MTRAPLPAQVAVTPKEAAELASLSIWSIYSLLNSGAIEGRYFGRKRLVLYSSLQQYIEGLPQDAPVTT